MSIVTATVNFVTNFIVFCSIFMSRVNRRLLQRTHKCRNGVDWWGSLGK